MIYKGEEVKKIGLYRPIWACAYERDYYSARKGANRFVYKCEPVEGMLTKQNSGIKKENRRYDPDPRYFVPVKKNGETYELEDLAWSRVVPIRTRYYADTEEECRQLYFQLIEEDTKKIEKAKQEAIVFFDCILKDNKSATEKERRKENE